MNAPATPQEVAHIRAILITLFANPRFCYTKEFVHQMGMLAPVLMGPIGFDFPALRAECRQIAESLRQPPKEQ